jgi:hypothetical protein
MVSRKKIGFHSENTLDIEVIVGTKMCVVAEKTLVIDLTLNFPSLFSLNFDFSWARSHYSSSSMHQFLEERVAHDPKVDRDT